MEHNGHLKTQGFYSAQPSGLGIGSSLLCNSYPWPHRLKKWKDFVPGRFIFFSPFGNSAWEKNRLTPNFYLAMCREPWRWPWIKNVTVSKDEWNPEREKCFRKKLKMTLSWHCVVQGRKESAVRLSRILPALWDMPGQKTDSTRTTTRTVYTESLGAGNH